MYKDLVIITKIADLPEVMELVEAATCLYNDNLDYARINNLVNIENNHSMKRFSAALNKLKGI